MAIPNVIGAFKGWTNKTSVELVEQTVESGRTRESLTRLDNVYVARQPVPVAQLNRKPEEQRLWKWWSIWLVGKTMPLLKEDDRIIVKGQVYRVENIRDWRDGHYAHYEVVEDYLTAITAFSPLYFEDEDEVFRINTDDEKEIFYAE